MGNHHNTEADKSKKTKYVNFAIEEGILICFFPEIEVMDLEVSKIAVSERIKFLKNVSYPTLFNFTKVESITKEARDYMASEGNEMVIASAILVNSPVHKMMANFFIMVNKPKNPTRMFTNIESAMEWLRQFKH